MQIFDQIDNFKIIKIIDGVSLLHTELSNTYIVHAKPDIIFHLNLYPFWERKIIIIWIMKQWLNHLYVTNINIFERTYSWGLLILKNKD